MAVGEEQANRAAAEVAFTYGLRAFNHQDYDEAHARFEEAVREDPGDGLARYWRGLCRLKIGDAPGAAEDLQASLEVERPAPVDRSRVLTDLATAQVEAGDLSGALQSLDAALAADPDSATALYLQGVAKARTGDRESGRLEVERARSLDPTLPEIAMQLPAEQLPAWEIRIGASYGPDSNPANLRDDLVALDPATGDRVDGRDNAGAAQLRLEAHPFYDRAGWSLGLRLDGYQSRYDEFGLFDYGRARGVVQLAWGTDPRGYVTGPIGYTRVPFGESRVSLLVQAGSDFGDLDGESYSRTHELAVSTMLREGRGLATQVELDYQDITLFDNPAFTFEAGVFSGHRSTLKVSQYLFGQGGRYVRLGVLGGGDRRNDQLDSTIREGSLEASIPLHRRLALNVAGSLRRDDFAEPVDGSAHEHDTVTAAASLVWAIGHRFYVTAAVSRIDRDVKPDSVDDLFEYDRTTASIGLTWFY